MITDIISGDITAPTNKRNIIIGMNTEMGEPSIIGKPFAKKVIPIQLIHLGSVLTFRFDQERLLHMIICHHLEKGGWRNADQFVRYGLDYLWQLPNTEQQDYSIVQIGRGKIGQRDGANCSMIHSAIATSWLPVTMFVHFEGGRPAPAERVEQPSPLEFVEGWSSRVGRMLNTAVG